MDRNNKDATSIQHEIEKPVRIVDTDFILSEGDEITILRNFEEDKELSERDNVIVLKRPLKIDNIVLQENDMIVIERSKMPNNKYLSKQYYRKYRVNKDYEIKKENINTKKSKVKPLSTVEKIEKGINNRLSSEDKRHIDYWEKNNRKYTNEEIQNEIDYRKLLKKSKYGEVKGTLSYDNLGNLLEDGKPITSGS